MSDPRTHTNFPHGGDDSAQHGHGESFTPNELAHFQGEDCHAARAIVSLMLGVFSLGFFGSLTIALIAAGGWE